jgi:hypothetical protein
MAWSLFDVNNTPIKSFEKEIFEHMVKTISIRKSNSAIAFGYLITLYVDTFIYAYMRAFRNNVVIVVINNGREAMSNPLTIHINANANIPTRIKHMLTDGTILESQYSSMKDMKIISGDFQLQLPRKIAGVYRYIHNL